MRRDVRAVEERVERHIYQYVEAELRNYRTYKKLIAEYDAEYSPIKSCLDKDQSGIFAKGATGDSTYSTAIKVMANNHRIDRAKDIVMCIDDVLEELSEQESKLIEMKYFKGYYTDYGIMRELHLPSATYYRHKRQLIVKFARRMRLI